MIENLPNVETLGYPVGEDARDIPETLYAVVEVPAYIELLSNTYKYSREMPAPQVEAVERQGRPYNRYVFAPPAKDTKRWARLFTQWIPRPTQDDRAAPGEFIWHFETPEGPEAEQTFPIKLLPELPQTRPPKLTLVHFWTAPSCNVDPDKLGPVLTFLSRAGVNLLPWWESKADDLKKAGCYDKGIKLFINQGGMSGWPQMGKPADDLKYKNRDYKGEAVDSQDFQWVIDAEGEPWANDLRVCTGYAAKVDAMAQDIEWQPIYKTGFSPAGIEAFAKINGLDAAGLTPGSIWRDHRKSWGDFRAEQFLTAASYYTKAAREGNPEAYTVWLPGSPYTTTDADLMSDMIQLGEDNLGRMVYLPFPFPADRMQEGFDVLQPMWYGHGVGQVREAFEWSRAISRRVKIPLVPIYLGQGREFYYTGGDPGEALRAIAWAGILGGARGYGYWLAEFSPLQYSWLARTNRELARLEDILLGAKPDPAGVSVEPMPKKRFTLVSGEARKTFSVPDFDKLALWRAYGIDDTRLLGIINLDAGTELYTRVRLAGLPDQTYHVLDVSEGKLLRPDRNRTSFTPRQLADGIPVMTPAGYGVKLLLIGPSTQVPIGGREPLLLQHTRAAYEEYREPDTEGSILAQRGKLTVRHDVTPDGAQAILVESPAQKLWIRHQLGGIIGDWEITKGARRLVEYSPPHGGAAVDLFWSPAEAHWSGDEKLPYELVYAKVHGSKAHIRLRQAKQTPALQGLVFTKTFIVPEEGTDVQVKVRIDNMGPAPSIGFSYWPHHTARVSARPQTPPEDEQTIDRLYMATDAGPAAAPLKEIVWCKPQAENIPGNESWERAARNGTMTGEWIAQHNPATRETLLCQSEGPPVVQFYSWRDKGDRSNLSLEWMYPYTELKAGRAWETSYVMRYVPSVEPAQIPAKLLKAVP